VAKPTERALKRKPQAVILMAWQPGKSDGDPGDWDFEWFETDDNRSRYYEEAVKWNEQDVVDNTGDDALLYLAVEVLATADMKLGRMSVQPENAETKALLARYKKAPATLVAKPAVKKAETGAGEVKAKRVSPAAQAAGVAKEDTTPQVKPKVVRKPAAPKAPGTGPKGAPEAKAANLKARLAAKAAKPGEKKSEAGDPPPPSTAFVVKKASTEPEAGVYAEPSKARSA
jgi:hypothetical protein